jgi:hypothetical protein
MSQQSQGKVVSTHRYQCTLLTTLKYSLKLHGAWLPRCLSAWVSCSGSPDDHRPMPAVPWALAVLLRCASAPCGSVVVCWLVASAYLLG